MIAIAFLREVGQAEFAALNVTFKLR